MVTILSKWQTIHLLNLLEKGGFSFTTKED